MKMKERMPAYGAVQVPLLVELITNRLVVLTHPTHGGPKEHCLSYLKKTETLNLRVKNITWTLKPTLP